MLDHRILLISLLAAFLAFHTVPSFFQDSTETTSAARVEPIEVEPDGVLSGERGEG